VWYGRGVINNTSSTTRRVAQIFEEVDGFHYCDADLPFFCARGTGYRSISAALRAIIDSNPHREYAYTHFQRGAVICKLEAAS
jgi:hypothetical protein